MRSFASYAIHSNTGSRETKRQMISATTMPIATKPDSVVTFDEEIPSIKSEVRRPFDHVVLQGHVRN